MSGGPVTPSMYDKTFAKLVARYGAERARNIAAGNDAAANADILAWKRLCANGEKLGARPQLNRSHSPTDQVMTYAAREVPASVISIRTGLPVSKVVEIIEAHA